MSWISVDERLPEYDIAVTTIGKNEDGTWTTPITAQLHACDGRNRFISGFSFGGVRLIKTLVETIPTHWQPLPEPPEK